MFKRIRIKQKRAHRTGSGPLGRIVGIAPDTPTEKESKLSHSETVRLLQEKTRIITDVHEINTLTPTTNGQILDLLSSLGDKTPAIITEDLEIYAIANDELNQNENIELNKIINLVKRFNPVEDMTQHQVTRPVFDSYIDSRKETNLQEESKETSAYVQTSLIGAIKNKATDIHIEIKRNNCYVRERTYGQLRQAAHFNSQQGLRMIHAIWNLYVNQNFSNADIAKDGRFEFRYAERNWLCRVSYAYSKVTKERSIAIRLRDMQHIPPLETLGYSDQQLRLIKRSAMTKGMMLMIGSVNSGKSTTQTAIMNEQPKDRKNFELSDQIEVNVDHFVQIQIPTEGKQEFIEEQKERLRRVSTRHDVNFIAINEIRDKHTASMASSMLLQGTTAISSIHGSSWSDAINRMKSPTDLDISEDILFSESFLSLIITQTLVGVLCDDCKLNICPKPGYQDYFKTIFGEDAIKKIHFHNKEGCDTCERRGVKALTLAAETIPVNESNRHLLKDTTNAQAMRDWQQKNKIETIHQHAYGAVTKGKIDPLIVEEKIGPFTPFNLFEAYKSNEPIIP